VERTQGSDGAGQRPAGWYPDPRDAARRRYWDGERWSELTATGDAGLSAGTATDAGDPGAPGPGDRRGPLLIAAAVVVVLLLAAAGWAVLGGSDEADEAAAASTTSSTPDGSDRDGPDPDATDTTAAPSVPASTAAPDDLAPTTAQDTSPADGPGEPCEADATVLLGLLKAHPPLASFADGLGVERTRCVGDWSSAVVTSPDADRALALFEREGDGWTLVLLGSAEPCAGLGIPAADEATLGCGEW
jgi:hypothetical protein